MPCCRFHFSLQKWFICYLRAAGCEVPAVDELDKLLAKMCEALETEISTGRAASAIGCDRSDANLFLDLDHPKLAFDFEIVK